MCPSPSAFFDENYRNFIIKFIPDGGAEWLNAMPTLLADCEKKWNIQVQPPYPLSINYVAPVIRADGSPAVIKVNIPLGHEAQDEINALRFYNGHGAVRLLESDDARRVFLMEMAYPGQVLKDLPDDEEATRIAARVMRKLFRPATPEIAASNMKVEEWARGLVKLCQTFAGGTGPFHQRAVEMAESIFAELLPDQHERVVLHGDMHHLNVLSSDRDGWLAIDPKGVIGEPEYEVGALIRNPMPQVITWVNLDQFQQRRIAILCEELGFDRQRVLRWSYAQVVLSAWWSYEESQEVWWPWMAIAESLERIMRGDKK